MSHTDVDNNIYHTAVHISRAVKLSSINWLKGRFPPVQLLQFNNEDTINALPLINTSG